MKIHRLDAGTVALEEIDPFIAGLLRKIPASADAEGSERARSRLFPPITEGRDRSADAEWRELVEPGLRELFRDALGVVEEDLVKLAVKTGAASLRLPLKNLEAWIHALNQARLALVARHDFSDDELERQVAADGGERAFVLFQVHFYGLLQEFLLRQLE